MEHRKHGARLFGLLAVAAVGVMAFAASAQAVVPGFLIEKKAFATLTKVTASTEGVSTMLVPGLGFELNCTAFVVDEGAIESKTDAVFVLLYTGCTTLVSNLPTKEEIDCHVTEPIKVEALFLPAELKAPTLGAPAVLAEKLKTLIRLHSKATALTAEPKPCILPLDNIVTGEICFQINNNDTATPLLLTNASVECKERPTLEALTESAGVKDVVKYGAQVITFDAAATLLSPAPVLDATLGVSLY